MKPTNTIELRELDALLAPGGTLTDATRLRLRELMCQLSDLRTEYANLAEANLATKEQLDERKSAPKYWHNRQDSINYSAIEVCRRHELPDDKRLARCARLSKIKVDTQERGGA